jgi:CheY-like chemotaxis protein
VFFELYRQRQQLAEQRDALEAQAEALREADRRKDEFLATLSHELRNPLAPLRHGLDILHRAPEGERADEIRQMMDRQLAHLMRLIDDLLDVSRISQGKIELRKERIQITDIIRSAVEISRPVIEGAGHTLQVDVPAQPVWLHGDLTRLAQVIGNLLHNAVKYTQSGGVIRLAAHADGDDVVISVTDNGVGIPKEMLSAVFQLFAQVNQHLDRARGGLGIGLALVRQLVTLHGGTVSAESEGIDRGSTFTVRIPLLVDDVSTSDEASGMEAPQAATGMKVLIVDDMIEVAQTVGWLLEEMGHSYRMVHDGREAIAAAHDFWPDVILLDIGLPGMDGYTVCRLLREDPDLKDTTIIAQSGWGQDTHKVAAMEAGFDHHLIKPVEFKTLERLLAEVATAKT